MDTTYAKQNLDEVLESASNPPDVSHIFENLGDKSLEECIAIARETLYEGVNPLLRTAAEDDAVAEFNAIMEVTWQKLQDFQSSKSQGRSRSGSTS